MSLSRVYLLSRTVIFFMSLIPIAASGQAAGTTRIHGKVVERESDAPLAGVIIQVVGTRYGTTTDGDGRFALRRPVCRTLPTAPVSPGLP